MKLFKITILAATPENATEVDSLADALVEHTRQIAYTAFTVERLDRRIDGALEAEDWDDEAAIERLEQEFL